MNTKKIKHKPSNFVVEEVARGWQRCNKACTQHCEGVAPDCILRVDVSAH
jgi:hypothetical protein